MAEVKPIREKKPYNENSFINVAAPYLLAFLGIFLAITFIFRESMNVVGYIATVSFGLFSSAMWLAPFALLLVAARWRADAPKGLVKFRFICLALCTVFLAAFIHLVWAPEAVRVMNPKELYAAGTSLSGGGVVGGWICFLLEKLCGNIGTGIITASLAILFGFLLFGITIADLWTLAVSKTRELMYDASNARAQRREEAENARQRELKKQRELSELGAGTDAEEGDSHAEAPSDKSGCKKKKTAAETAQSNAESEDGSDTEAFYEELTGEGENGKEKDKESGETVIGGIRKRAADFIDEMFTDNETFSECPPDDEADGRDEAFPDLSAFDTEPVTDDLNGGSAESGEKGDADGDTFLVGLFGNMPEPSAKGDASSDGLLADIFCEDAVIEGAGTTISAKNMDGDATAKAPEEFGIFEEGEDGEPPFDIDTETITPDDLPDPAQLYEFPPIDMLPGNPNPSVFKVTEELTQKAKSLVDTLASFGVRAKVQNICCGPTVTRYELKPEIGVKVRSIQNLADDIALHLRAASVRIEAPIPGKDAVGIEIPNDTVSTVYIRELIDRDEFRDLKSNLSVALGMDVSGTPVYMDIVKMPHLLIAGATGMGKSVCINSIIISMIYKARPDEVKLILIDPKKVEFSMYDRIPHLLVPVVTEPKKAAGSLAWAVNEMEYRFNLIEAAKCRDLKSYNAVAERDPRFKKLPQIVIIIDELADLMMTARDEVETSICRLAQKARAAGMHLIIGTQRPSVDVITGVIKGNIPSRIAFTVASQVDSRTIIDNAGAESLLGKGDMLFSPVGLTKPVRVQGSFVGPDSVIEEITDFLRSSGIDAYDESIQSAIDAEAAKCGEKKKGKGGSQDSETTFVGSSEGFERDEMMLPALGLGVEMGQISTSLIQRRLSLGYARAARIVDMLSEMGFVGPFEGSKPRKVLITREEYIELKAKEHPTVED